MNELLASTYESLTNIRMAFDYIFTLTPLSSHPLSAPSSTSQATGFTQASRVHKQGTGHRGLRNFHTARMGKCSKLYL